MYIIHRAEASFQFFFLFLNAYLFWCRPQTYEEFLSSGPQYVSSEPSRRVRLRLTGPSRGDLLRSPTGGTVTSYTSSWCSMKAGAFLAKCVPTKMCGNYPKSSRHPVPKATNWSWRTDQNVACGWRNERLTGSRSVSGTVLPGVSIKLFILNFTRRVRLWRTGHAAMARRYPDKSGTSIAGSKRHSCETCPTDDVLWTVQAPKRARCHLVRRRH